MIDHVSHKQFDSKLLMKTCLIKSSMSTLQSNPEVGNGIMLQSYFISKTLPNSEKLRNLANRCLIKYQLPTELVDSML